MRLVRVAVAALGIFPISMIHPVHAETLGGVLSAHNVPLANVPDREQRREIVGFAIAESDSLFLIAYYDGGSNVMPPVLHVLRYDVEHHHLRRADLRGLDRSFDDFDQVMSQIPDTCMRSAEDISERNGLIAIETHINPSAGCLLILNQDLSFSAGLWGWVIGSINGQLIVQEDTVHWASTHPARLFVYDPQRKKATHIYPAENDRARQEFSAALRNALPPNEWCMQKNNPCDPETFDTDIDHFAVDQGANEFSFDAVMNPDGFGDKAEKTIPARTVRYVCRLRNGKWIVSSAPSARSGSH
jgi:hypothetical protein